MLTARLRVAGFASGAILAVACARQSGLTARATPVPASLDSAAQERWVAAQRRGCRQPGAGDPEARPSQQQQQE